MGNFPFSTEEVLNLMGYPTGNKESIYIQCPFCKSRKKPLNVNLKTSLYRCNKNPDHKGNILTFYKEVMGCQSNKEAYHEITDRLNIKDKSYIPKIEIEECKECEIDKEKNAKVLEVFLEKSYLTKQNREDLLARGFTLERIKELKYKTLPSRNGKEIVEFVNSLGISLGIKDFSGVIGFFISKKNYWVVAHYMQGIMVPYRDFYGNIQSIQIRKDENTRKIDPETGEKEHKYGYLTSRNKKRGTAAKQCVHYSGVFGGDGLLVKNGTLVLIEGGMKGDLFYDLTGQPAINIPGVNCISILEKEFEFLKTKGIHTIMNGLDMDRVLNINVLESLVKIEKLIKKHEFFYKQLTWNTEYTTVDQKKANINVNTTFVFTPETLEEELEMKRLTETLQRIQRCNRTKIMFAVNTAEKLQEKLELFHLLKKQCSNFNFTEVTPIIWELKDKGIDDYYVSKIRKGKEGV